MISQIFITFHKPLITPTTYPLPAISPLLVFPSGPPPPRSHIFYQNALNHVCQRDKTAKTLRGLTNYKKQKKFMTHTYIIHSS